MLVKFCLPSCSVLRRQRGEDTGENVYSGLRPGGLWELRLDRTGPGRRALAGCSPALRMGCSQSAAVRTQDSASSCFLPLWDADRGSGQLPRPWSAQVNRVWGPGQRERRGAFTLSSSGCLLEEGALLPWGSVHMAPRAPSLSACGEATCLLPPSKMRCADWQSMRQGLFKIRSSKSKGTC